VKAVINEISMIVLSKKQASSKRFRRRNRRIIKTYNAMYRIASELYISAVMRIYDLAFPPNTGI